MKTKRLRVLLACGLGAIVTLVLLWRLGGSTDVTLAQAGTGVVRVATTGSDTSDCGSDVAPCATVQHAVDLAREGDVIKVAGGVYTGVNSYGGLAQMVYVSKSVTIQGGYTTTDWSASHSISYPTTLDAQGQGRVFYVSGALGATIEGLRITGGDATGMEGHVEQWRATDDAGGGVYAVSATLTFKDNQVFSNTADHGGGVYAANAEALLVGNQVFSNTVGQNGGGMYVINAAGEEKAISNTITIVGNQVFSNTAGQDGGGIYFMNSADEYTDQATLVSATTTIVGNQIFSNVAAEGGGLHTVNTLDHYGGEMHHIKATTTISANQVFGNVAGGGGGLYLESSVATLSGNAITANRAVWGGGGLYMGGSPYASLSGRPMLQGNTITANRTGGNGGGLYLSFVYAAFNANRIISNNADYGGGLHLFYSGGTFTNTVVTDNRAENAGSGVYAGASWSRWFHTTVARNRGGDGSGILVAWYPFGTIYPFSQIVMTNTLVASHSVGITMSEGITWAPGNAVTMDGVLWYDNGANTDGTGTVTVTHAYTGDPAFASDGYHLSAASAAIDRGVDARVPADVDGQPRPNGLGYDLGADEFWRPTLEVSKRAHPNPIEAGARLTYTLAVTNNGALDLHATVTDTLSPHVSTDESLAGTVVLPGGELVWRPVISAGGGVWTRQVVVTVALQYENETVKVGYAGPLTNVVQVTTQEGPAASATQTTLAVLEYPAVYLPLVTWNYPRYENALLNPGFEGIGLPEDNDAPNPENYTHDTFNGEVYSEIFTPEGWVTWWEESDVYRRPEARVIPREPPYTDDPARIYQGYYAAMYFSFYGRHNAGYYQRVEDLPPGAPVTLYAHAHAWSCEYDFPSGYSCGNQENQGFRVGIDPGGGVDPWSPDVIWSARVSLPDVYGRVGPLCVRVGPGGAVTVFLRSDVQWWPYKHSDAYWDNAALMVPVR